MIVRKLFTLLGFKTDKKGFRDADKSLNRIKQTAIRVAGILVAGKIVKSIAGIATETAKLADEVSKVADKLGVGTSALQEFRFAAQLTGVSTRTADLALQRFTRRTAEAAKGEGEAKAALKELNVQLTDSQGQLRPVSELLADAAEGLKNAKTQGDRLRLSFKLFDSEGAALVNTLKGGRDAFNEMAQAARDTGGIFDEELIRSSVEFTDQQLKMRLVLRGVKNVIAKELLPFMIRATNRTIDWVKANRQLIRSNIVRFIQRTTLAMRRLLRFMRRLFGAFNELPKASRLFLGVAAAIGVISLILSSPIALMLLFIGLVALIIEDFETWKEGGDSLFGRISFWLDNLTGVWAGLRDAGTLWFKLIKFQFDFLINLIGTFATFIIKIFSGDISDAFTTLGQQVRVLFEDVFDFIEDIIKDSPFLRVLFSFLGGKQGKFKIGGVIEQLATGSKFINPLFLAEQAGQRAGSLSQSTSNVFNVAGENADVIAGKIVDKIIGVNKSNNRQAAAAFKRRAVTGN